ncbi:GH25 family lysozyme [Streptomyces sp. NBC_01515]|uniref:GH25 family lysozyme n=1 Tax=Streptomyces sp. NBC_01515 TaxID=2903890 RepID=UPI003863AE88
MATSRGMDVSAYQGTQDWAALKKAGLAFAFAKASEGQHSRDASFDKHIGGIIKAGLVPGAYHFAWPNQSAAVEAANYVAAVKPYAKAGSGFTHWLDLERYSDGRNYAGSTAAQIKAYAAAWIAAVEKAFPGQRVGVYTSASDLSAGHVPADVPLWYPAYPGARVDTYAEAEAAAQPKPSGRAPLIWQFTSDPAGAARVDQSIAYLSETALRAWAGSGQTTTPAKPSISLSKVIAAARYDPAKAGTPVSYAGVKTVEDALVAEGLLAKKYADGHFGSLTVAAYAALQRRYGYSGADANGIPGEASLTRLGKAHGFTVKD